MKKIKRDLKFSIRKFKVGIGSVAIGAIFLISSNGEVEAAKLTNESQMTIKGTEQQESSQEEATRTNREMNRHHKIQNKQKQKKYQKYKNLKCKNW